MSGILVEPLFIFAKLSFFTGGSPQYNPSESRKNKTRQNYKI